MRLALETWGRLRWPGARIMHELPVGGCRIDLAFITTNHIVGVEIKSSRDTLKRLAHQMTMYCDHLPEVWCAYAPRWNGEIAVPWNVGALIVDRGIVDENIPYGIGDALLHKRPPKEDRGLTVPALWLCHKIEMMRIAERHGVLLKPRMTCRAVIAALARGLTGDQIISGVCEHLRARRTSWAADAPVLLERVAA